MPQAFEGTPSSAADASEFTNSGSQKQSRLYQQIGNEAAAGEACSDRRATQAMGPHASRCGRSK